MAVFEYWMDTDLTRLPDVLQMGRMFSQDSEANLIGVRVTRNGEPVQLAGTVEASVILGDGTTITEDGELDGNAVWVILPEEAYAVVGKIGIFLRLTQNGETTTLGGVETYVRKSM